MRRALEQVVIDVYPQLEEAVEEIAQYESKPILQFKRTHRNQQQPTHWQLDAYLFTIVEPETSYDDREDFPSS